MESEACATLLHIFWSNQIADVGAAPLKVMPIDLTDGSGSDQKYA
jgi:hypothetical protein